MKLFQWFILAFLLSFNTLTNSIFAADDSNAEDTSESEEGEGEGDGDAAGEGEGDGEEPEEAEEESGE